MHSPVILTIGNVAHYFPSAQDALEYLSEMLTPETGSLTIRIQTRVVCPKR